MINRIRKIKKHNAVLLLITITVSSKNIRLDVNATGNLIDDMVRTHRVAIYTEKTNEFLEKLKTANK